MHSAASHFSSFNYWLALWYTPGIGPVRFFQLLEIFPDLEEFFKLSATQLQQINVPSLAIPHILQPNWQKIEQDLRWAEQPQHHIIHFNHDFYPHLLRHIAQPPPILFLKGNPELLAKPQLAMVGSRHPSVSGINLAKQFAHQIVDVGLIITSGLAQGIDTASHQGALQNNGKTIAVLGTGVDTIYPTSNKSLADQILVEGALVSEFPLAAPPHPSHFPQRNRIISGLSLGVLVVEAALQSGSLITARHAIEQDREVFAIPGNIHNPAAKGCHALLRQGAKLVETIEDILEELSPIHAPTASIKNPLTLSKNAPNLLNMMQKQLLEYISEEPIPIDILIEHSKLAPDTVASTLLILELHGYIRTTSSGYIKI